MGMPFEDPDMQEIFEGFLVETQELLDSVSQDLMVLENQPDDLDLLNQIFRSFHTIKGTSSFMGFEDITEITHHAEDLLNKLRRSELKVNQPIIDVLLEVHDWIEVLIEKIQTGDTEPPDFHDTINVIDTLARGEMPDEAEPAQSVQSAPEEQPETETTAEDDTQKPDTTPPSASAVDAVLGNPEIGSGEGDFSDEELALLDAAFAEVNQSFHKGRKEEEPEDADISDTDEPAPKADVPDKDDIVSDLPDKAEKSEPKKPVPPPTKPDAHAPGTAKKPKVTSETIRVDVARVESLMDLSGELVLGRNRLAQLTEQLENKAENKESVRDFIENTAQIDFVTSEIQAAVMRMRMVPVGKLYQKAPRIVRDLSREFKKQIKLVVKGEETEIDRGIIEELNDPLVHMIRNSCDHGIESPQDRMEKGKPAQGTITLDAEQEGNNIVLKISDDGQGMDPEKIKSKAIEKGIITEEQASQMSSREAYQLIFMPGFSTAQKVSNVSGRGVGMDVVRTNIQNLKGMIEIESAPGKGSTFIIKLPLTLAIIQGLLVKVFNETYAIPLSSVVEVVSIDLESIYSINQQEVIRIREEVQPLIRLDKALGLPKVREELANRNVVVVGHGVQRVGLVVDQLLGQQEIVIKSLGEYLGSISGIAGSTILGDGRVIMIIDIAELIETVYSNKYTGAQVLK